MSYRTIKIDWLPQSGTQWKTFTAARLEAGRLWSWLVERHATARQQGGKWPTKAELQKDIKRPFPDLHSQSAQQIVADFCEAIASAESLRKRGEAYEYPHKKPRYRQVIFTNQGTKVRNRVLSLPCDKAGRLSVRIPKGVALPGRLREVRLDYGCVEIVCEISAAPRSGSAILGIDLNDAAQKMGRKQAQTVASACNRKIIALLHYKLAACIAVEEAYTSQTCPVCGERSKHRRTYRCRCGFVAPRDVVGSTNIRTIGIDGALRPGCSVPNAVYWEHPSKYPATAVAGSAADTSEIARAKSREAAGL